MPKTHNKTSMLATWRLPQDQQQRVSICLLPSRRQHARNHKTCLFLREGLVRIWSDTEKSVQQIPIEMTSSITRSNSKLNARTSLCIESWRKRRSSFELWALKEFLKISSRLGLSILFQKRNPKSCPCFCTASEKAWVSSKIRAHINLYTYINLYEYSHGCLHIHACDYTYIYVHIYIYTYIYKYIHTYVHRHAYIYIYSNRDVRTHSYIYI